MNVLYQTEEKEEEKNYVSCDATVQHIVSNCILDLLIDRNTAKPLQAILLEIDRPSLWSYTQGWDYNVDYLDITTNELVLFQLTARLFKYLTVKLTKTKLQSTNTGSF